MGLDAFQRKTEENNTGCCRRREHSRYWPGHGTGQLGDLVAAIDASGARQIHDIVYPEAREGDDQLLGALLETNGAVIAQVPALDSNLESASIGVISHAALGLDCGSSGLDLDYANNIAPAEIFSECEGHNAAIIDSDGGSGEVPPVCAGDAVYPSLALAAFLQLSSHSDWSVEIERGAGFFEPEALSAFRLSRVGHLSIKQGYAD